MVYTAEHPALAALEILAGWELYSQLQGYSLYSCTFAEDLLEAAPPNFDIENKDIKNKEVTRACGDTWLREKRSVALKVMSVVAPGYNVLLNPDHSRFTEVNVEPLGPFNFEERMTALVKQAKST